MGNLKKEIAVLQSDSVRGIINTINSINKSEDCPILREDIVDILNVDGCYYLLYFK